MVEIEKENIPVSGLGAWLKKQYTERLHSLMREQNYGHILKKSKTGEELMEWYEGELARLNEQLQVNLGTIKDKFYRQEMIAFRQTFHKIVIYATWDWDKTVLDALHQAGFANFEEQTTALEKQREKKW